MSALSVAALYHYPIKSCRGHAVKEAVVTTRGLEADRLFMLTDAAGHFLTQREEPRLALIHPDLQPDLLTLRAPGMTALDLPIRTGGPATTVTIWGDRCRALDQGAAAAAWLGEYLGTPVRLMRIDDTVPRLVDPDFARAATDETGFADGFPFLLIGAASLAELNSRLAEPLAMNRFRPNIVVQGSAAFAEDAWQRIQIGPITFELVKPCARCKITTIDQASGVVGTEPLATLATFRRDPSGKVLFGQNMVGNGTGTIAVGDPVHLLA